MTSQPGKQIAIHISTNISRNKDNRAMQFGQLIEYNMRNILSKKNHAENLGISLDLCLKIYIVFFIVWQVEDYWNKLFF